MPRKGINIANPFDPFDPGHRKPKPAKPKPAAKKVTHPNQGVRQNVQRMATTGTGRYAMPRKKKK